MVDDGLMDNGLVDGPSVLAELMHEIVHRTPSDGPLKKQPSKCSVRRVSLAV
jgi:hypothetical protein